MDLPFIETIGSEVNPRNGGVLGAGPFTRRVAADVSPLGGIGVEFLLRPGPSEKLSGKP